MENYRGFLYIAYNDNFIKEMLFSAQSIKKHNPNLHITVFTNKMIKSPFVDEVKIINPKHIRPKVDYIAATPYKETVFVDTDIVAMRDLNEMFNILDSFDIAGAQDLARKRKKYSDVMNEYKDIPYSFSEINTGVLIFKSNDKTKKLFKDWKTNFYKYYNFCPWDQASFRISLWESIKNNDLKFHTLPPEYNIRSKSNREKQDRFHHEFGEEHLSPRIYHMHADPRINRGTYDIKSLEEIELFVKKEGMPY